MSSGAIPSLLFASTTNLWKKGDYVWFFNHSKNTQFLDKTSISGLAGSYYFWRLFFLIAVIFYAPTWFDDNLPQNVVDAWQTYLGPLFLGFKSMSEKFAGEYSGLVTLVAFPVAVMSPWLIYRLYDRINKKLEIRDLVSKAKRALRVA